jgi:hypothetical protein
MSMRTLRWALTALIGAALLVPGATLAQEASDDPHAFTVIPPDESPLGVTYPEWVGRWNQWFLGLPSEGHPADSDACQSGQSGDVFIIPSTFFGNTLETHCTVGADQHILISPGSISCGREPGDTDEALLACADEARATTVNISASVDGEAIPMIDAYWAVSPITPVELPVGNLYGMPAGVIDVAGGGWYLILEPLAPGTHTIVVHAETDYPDDEEGLLAAETIATVEVAPVEAATSDEPSE